MAKTRIAFPVIGHPIPDPSLSDAQMREELDRHTPHWLFHLTVEATANSAACWSGFPPITQSYLTKLRNALHLRRAFRVQPSEFLFGDLELPLEIPSLAPYPAMFSANSAQLAVALGMVAAAFDRPLPTWILPTGCLGRLDDNLLETSLTGGIEKKCRLAFGVDPGYQLTELLRRWYRHSATVRHLGSLSERWLPGKIRLILTSTELDTDPLAFGEGLEVDALEDCPLTDFGQGRFSELESSINERIEPKEILLVRVPTVLHALRFLGYHKDYKTGLFANRVLDDLPIQAYRIRHSNRGEDSSYQVTIATELEKLEDKVRSAPDQSLPGRLRLVLARVRRVLGGSLGEILVPSSHGGLLQVIARDGLSELAFLPEFMFDRGDSASVLESEKAEIVEEPSGDSYWQACRSMCERGSSPVPQRNREAYREHLDTIESYVRIPLRIDNTTYGVMIVLVDARSSIWTGDGGASFALAKSLSQLATQEIRRSRRRIGLEGGLDTERSLGKMLAALYDVDQPAEETREFLSRLSEFEPSLLSTETPRQGKLSAGSPTSRDFELDSNHILGMRGIVRKSIQNESTWEIELMFLSELNDLTTGYPEEKLAEYEGSNVLLVWMGEGSGSEKFEFLLTRDENGNLTGRAVHQGDPLSDRPKFRLVYSS